jgi:hypothetical protein
LVSCGIVGAKADKASVLELTPTGSFLAGTPLKKFSTTLPGIITPKF